MTAGVPEGCTNCEPDGQNGRPDLRGQHRHEHVRGDARDGHRHGPGGHAHDHRRAAGKRGLQIVLGLTATFMVAEFVGGWLANSLALMADAAHMLTDVAAITLSLFALWFAQRPAPPEKTYGYLRWEILAALVNGATLIVLSIVIFYQAYQRLRLPAQVESGLMLAVAVAGLLVNLFAAWLLHRSAGPSLNVRGAYLHVLGDLLGSVGAIAAALAIASFGWLAADPIISIFVGVLILISSWKLLRESVDVLLEAVPGHIDLRDVRQAIDEIPGVGEVHDLHVWTVTSGFLAMSGHAVVQDPTHNQRILEEIHQRMRERFGIRHVTVQLEREAMYVRERHL
ncbi:MAG: cation transporter [Gemmatimonadetes bacterium]|nr:cation transporter [Gemmatimonadota bacterium]